MGHSDDPRVVRSKEAILAATIAALGSEGLEATTIEGIAARAGVAKTTVYRHWPDRASLLLEAVERFAGHFEMPDTADVRADVVRWLTFLRDQMSDSPLGQALPAIVDASEHDDEIGAVLAAHSAERRARSLVRLDAAVERGELPADTDCELVQMLLVAPIFYRRLIRRTALSDREITQLVDHVLAGLTPAR